MAARMGSLRTRLAIATVAAFLALVAIYWFAIRQDTADPTVIVPRLAAAIGEGQGAIGVAGNGSLVRWLPLPQDPALPRLSLEAPPKGGQVKGPALEQVQVLAEVPDALRPYVARSRFGASGVSVELTTGIQLLFGDRAQARRKWQAAAAVLADPEITSLDYVDLRAPSRASWGGEEHELPPAP